MCGKTVNHMLQSQWAVDLQTVTERARRKIAQLDAAVCRYLMVAEEKLAINAMGAPFADGDVLT